LAIKKNAAVLAETVPGPTIEKFANLALRLQCWLAFGLITRSKGFSHFHNSQVLLSPTGDIAAKYDKRNLYGPDWKWAEPGKNQYISVQTEFGRIGLGICYDINFSELWDFLAKWVDIFAFSTNWVDDSSPLPLWQAVSRYAGVHLVAANNWGREQSVNFTGESAIISPDRGILAACGAETDAVIVYEIPVFSHPLQL